MLGEQLGRRAVLRAAVTLGLGIKQIHTAQTADGLDTAHSQQQNLSKQSIPSANKPPATKKDATRTSFEVSISSLKQTLTATVIDSKAAGPTALVVGGIHGDEEAGYRAATQLLDWTPAAGRFVVLPKSNPLAITHDARSTEHGDLNRHFRVKRTPSTPVARAVWRVFKRVNPDILISLHESNGIYNGEPAGIGQTVFHSPTKIAHDGARLGIRRANRTIGQQRFSFKTGHISPPDVAPSGLLAEKTTYETEIPSFIIETYEGVHLNARIRWQKAIVRGIVDYFDLTH